MAKAIKNQLEQINRMDAMSRIETVRSFAEIKRFKRVKINYFKERTSINFSSISEVLEIYAFNTPVVNE